MLSGFRDCGRSLRVSVSLVTHRSFFGRLGVRGRASCGGGVVVTPASSRDDCERDKQGGETLVDSTHGCSLRWHYPDQVAGRRRKRVGTLVHPLSTAIPELPGGLFPPSLPTRLPYSGADACRSDCCRSDPSGSSGIQADIPTFATVGAHATTVLTVLTAQNTHGITDFYPLTPAQVGAQLDALLGDLPPAATKTGLLFAEAVVGLVTDAAPRLGALVVDPVLVNSAGDLIVGEGVVDAYRELARSARVLTPNRWEAELLLGLEPGALKSPDAITAAGPALRELGAETVIVTGGRAHADDVVDVMVGPSGVDSFSSPRVGSDPIRGTGCTFAAALTANLAFGAATPAAVEAARALVQRQLNAGALRLGAGRPGVPHQFVGK